MCSLQVKELKKNQPSCSCYIVVTKSDLLNPPANTTASSMGPIPRVPACLSTAIKESPIVEGNEGSQPGVDNLQKGLRALNPTSSSPTSPFGQTAKSTNSPTSPFDRESSSDTQDRTTTAGLFEHDAVVFSPLVAGLASQDVRAILS